MHILWMPGVPILIRPVLALIELAGALIIKPFSLLVRLFANISAGHIVVMSLIAIMLDNLFPDMYGIGVYKNFIHVEERQKRAICNDI